MNFFTSWLKARRDRRIAYDLKRGYDWAAGELLRGRSIQYVASFECGFDSNSFDQGVNFAIRDWGNKLSSHECDQLEAKLLERQRCAELCRRPAGWLTPDQQKVADEIRNAILAGYGSEP